MKVNELSQELNITNKELISYLKDKDFKISSHMQNVTDEMIDMARDYFAKVEDSVDDLLEETIEELDEQPKDKKASTIYLPKKFELDDMIPCRSVTPWKLMSVGTDKYTVYVWNGFGDIEYVRYRDLQAMRRKNIIRKPKILIDNADLCYQWRNDLGDTYKHYIGVDYPEEFFDLSDEKFKRLLTKAPDVLKEVIKFTAINMVRNENYPTLQKLSIIDDLLGTCIKDFL